MSMQKLYQSVVQLQASSRVSELHFTNRMQIWQNMFFSTCWAGGKAQQEVEEKRCELINCKLERHIFPLTKSVPIRHQITSTLRITRWVLIDIWEGQGISKKPHAVVKRNASFRWYVPPDSVRFSIDVEESQKVIGSEGHILPLTRSMPIRTSVKVSVEDNSW